MIGCNVVVIQDFLHRNADGCTAAPQANQEGRAIAAADDQASEFKGVFQ
ncbi:MAG: hypothetical protein WDM77_18020 [Steroidobacteraceae bacterium]